MSGNVVPFTPRARHGRASAGSLAASAAKSAAVKPASRATSVERMVSHQSAGIDLRSPHLRTASGFAWMAKAMAKRDGQSSMTSTKEFGVLDMPGVIVQSVLQRKSELSCDLKDGLWDNPSMDRMSETEETAAYITRTREAREAKFKSQKPVYEFLQVKQSHYKHWETKRAMPRRFIPKFCTICEVSMIWLLTGEGNGPEVAYIAPKVEKRASKPRRARAA